MPEALQKACDTREEEIVLLYDHTRPNGKTAYSAISEEFTHQNEAENIAEGQHSAAKVVSDWMNVKRDRANILNAKFGYIGVGYMNTDPYRCLRTVQVMNR
jgi:uncharacterized protein YkwD